MALIVKDRVKETTATTGTGTITLAGAEDGFQAFSVIGNSNTTYYAIQSGDNWEVGLGTYTLSGTTLSRDTILESNNAGSAITLSGTSDVFCTYPAEKAVALNGTVINDANVVATANIVDDAVTADKLANSINAEIAANTAKTGITSGQAGEITANTAKVTNATHTGDVTGATALTIASNVVNADKLNVTGDGTSGQALTSDADGSMTWATILGASAGGAIYENLNSISADFTFGTNKNGMSVGPITIAATKTVTVPGGQRWVIL
jgi:hypothetical protein